MKVSFLLFENSVRLTFHPVVQQDTFANNRLSLTLVRSPASDCLLLATGLDFSGAQALPDTLWDPEFGPSNESTKSAFMYHIQDKKIKIKDFFEYLDVYVSINLACPSCYLISSLLYLA